MTWWGQQWRKWSIMIRIRLTVVMGIETNQVISPTINRNNRNNRQKWIELQVVEFFGDRDKVIDIHFERPFPAVHFKNGEKSRFEAQQDLRNSAVTHLSVSVIPMHAQPEFNSGKEPQCPTMTYYHGPETATGREREESGREEGEKERSDE